MKVGECEHAAESECLCGTARSLVETHSTTAQWHIKAEGNEAKALHSARLDNDCVAPPSATEGKDQDVTSEKKKKARQ